MRGKNPKGKIHWRTGVQSAGVSHPCGRQSELSRVSPGGLHTQTGPMSAEQAALCPRTGVRMLFQGPSSPPPRRMMLGHGLCLSQLGSQLVSSWDTDGQASTLGVYTAHGPRRPALHTEEIQQSFAELRRKEEGSRCLGPSLPPGTRACPARGTLHEALICRALFYKFSL